MSLEEELKQLIPRYEKSKKIRRDAHSFAQMWEFNGRLKEIDEVLGLLRVHTEKIRELFAKLAEKEECYPKRVGDEWYFIDIVESKHILKLEREVLAELTTLESGEE